MAIATCTPALSGFASHVLEGLSREDGKRLSPVYFYDELGTALFEAITLLPEYGLTRADERLLSAHSGEIAAQTGPLSAVAELGSGSGKKSLHVLRPAQALNPALSYHPIDVSHAALEACQREIGSLCTVRPICKDWIAGLSELETSRSNGRPLLLLFLGSSIGNLERDALPDFLQTLRAHLRPRDYLLLGADLVKDAEVMLAAYNDPTGVTAAFNLNLLNRINRELEANFDLSTFAHEVRWDTIHRRIEMHLLCCRDQLVESAHLGKSFSFRAGETIWTESSHKFDGQELDELARATGFDPQSTWIDKEWPFAEALWQVRA